MTTIHQPLDAIGEAAARLLYQRIAEKPQKPWQVESLKNGTYFLPEITERDSVSHFQHDHNEIELSAREAECLTWTAKGKTSWEIAVILGIAESTVSFH
ncbi:MAG: LuxR C-terminal-related transcriptional regulator, partial [Granulosicoccus sp.]|nr:LuxR C-terminal-related transcriptional regulator [Granulosicoccus sp.]